jgi:hypothetical protein
MRASTWWAKRQRRMTCPPCSWPSRPPYWYSTCIWAQHQMTSAATRSPASPSPNASAFFAIKQAVLAARQDGGALGLVPDAGPCHGAAGPAGLRGEPAARRQLTVSAPLRGLVRGWGAGIAHRPYATGLQPGHFCPTPKSVEVNKLACNDGDRRSSRAGFARFSSRNHQSHRHAAKVKGAG